MKKFSKILSLMFLALVTLVLVACGETTTAPTEAPTAAPTEAPTTVETFAEAWSHDDDYHWHASLIEGSTNVADKAEHTWGEGVVTTAATYDAEGVMTYTCSVCGATKTEAIAKLEHAYSEDWTADETNHWHVCTDEGYTDLKADEAAHIWDDGVETKKGTLTTKSEITYTCTVCGETKVEEGDFETAWEVADGSYMTDIESRNEDIYNYTITVDENYNFTLKNASLNNWNCIMPYCTGDTAGYGLVFTYSGTANSTMDAQLIVKINDDGSYCYYLKAEANQEATNLYLSGSQLPETMDRIVFMLYTPSADAEIVVQAHFVKLVYSETASYEYDADAKAIVAKHYCTTEGFTSLYTQEETTYAVENKTLAEVVALANALEDKAIGAPVLVTAFVTELINSKYGNAYLASSDAILQMYGCSANLNAGLSYSVAEGVVSASWKNPTNFLDAEGNMPFAEGAYVTFLCVPTKYGTALECYCEILSVSETTTLQNSGYVCAPSINTPENGTAVLAPESGAYGTEMTVTATPNTGYVVSSIVVTRASGTVLKLASGEVFAAGVKDTIVVTFEKYEYKTKHNLTSADLPTAYCADGEISTFEGTDITGACYKVANYGNGIQMQGGKNAFVVNTKSVGVISGVTITRLEKNASKVYTLAVYVSNSPITSVEGLTAYETITLAAPTGTGTETDPYVYTTEATLAITGVYQYVALVSTNSKAQYIENIEIATEVPTENVLDVRTATLSQGNMTTLVAYNSGDSFTLTSKGSWFGYKGFVAPTSPKYLVMVVSATGYAGENAYGMFKLDDISNHNNANQLEYHLTSDFQVMVIDISTYNNMSLISTTEQWKVAFVNYEADASGTAVKTVYYIWQCYFITEASA